MKIIYNTENRLFANYRKMIGGLGGYNGQFTSGVYGIWLREWTEEKHRNISETLERFIDSGDFRLNHLHMGARE
ncbi:MAG: hypothetical protein RQ867_02510 [Mariprofundaceae bacterium]|nr:hypothetical protein [Mariprofundaceae bacterium]